MTELERLPNGQPVQTKPDSVHSIGEELRGELKDTTSLVIKEYGQGSMIYRFHDLPMEGDVLAALCERIIAESKDLQESVTEIVIDLHDLRLIKGNEFVAIFLFGLPKKLRKALPKKKVRIVGIHPHVRQKIETLRIGPHIPATLEYAEAAETGSGTAV